MKGNNELIPMTRRTPSGLKKKQLEMDAKVAKKLVHAWDVEHDEQKVFDIFMKYKDKLSNQRYWETLRTVWIVCGSVERSNQFRALMDSMKPFSYYFSTPEELDYFNNEIPSTVIAYRATNNINDNGLSWTISKEYAEYYQKEFDKKHIVTKVFFRDEIYAYINRNDEQEIIIL